MKRPWKHQFPDPPWQKKTTQRCFNCCLDQMVLKIYWEYQWDKVKWGCEKQRRLDSDILVGNCDCGTNILETEQGEARVNSYCPLWERCSDLNNRCVCMGGGALCALMRVRHNRDDRETRVPPIDSPRELLLSLFFFKKCRVWELFALLHLLVEKRR